MYPSFVAFTNAMERRSLKKWNHDELEQFLYQAGNLERYSYEDESDVSPGPGSFVTRSASDVNEIRQGQLEGSKNEDVSIHGDAAHANEQTMEPQQNHKSFWHHAGNCNNARVSQVGPRNQSLTLPRASGPVIRRSSLPTKSLHNPSSRYPISSVGVVGSQEIYPDPRLQRASLQTGGTAEDESNHESWSFKEKVNYFMKRIQEQSPQRTNSSKLQSEKCYSQTP